MKYLHKFNENNTQSESLTEIKNFCNTNLAYLMDEGFKLDFLVRKNRIGSQVHKTVRVLLNKNGISDPNLFIWNDIKDDFIPFITLLSEKYKLFALNNKKEISFNFFDNKSKYDEVKFSIEDLEDLTTDSKILNIKFHVFL